MLIPVAELWAGRLARLREAGKQDDPELFRAAAAEFESILVAELLRSAREGGSGGWLGSGEEKAGGTMVELAEQQLAQALAAAGGLGLAALIAQGLSRKP